MQALANGVVRLLLDPGVEFHSAVRTRCNSRRSLRMGCHRMPESLERIRKQLDLMYGLTDAGVEEFKAVYQEIF